MPHENTITITADLPGKGRREVLIPSVVKGKQLSGRAASREFKKTGRNFGKFKTRAEARAAAVKRSESSHQRLRSSSSGKKLVK